MGYVDEDGEVKPPFIWNEERRLVLRAKLDAVFFHLYGITDRDDIRYIYSTFPIVEREEKAKYYGIYRSCELCLAYMNALQWTSLTFSSRSRCWLLLSVIGFKHQFLVRLLASVETVFRRCRRIWNYLGIWMTAFWNWIKNTAERIMKPVAIGRKNWMFAG